MRLEGFTPFDEAAAAHYGKRRWWLGITLGDMFDKASDLYPGREALVGSGKRYTYAELRRLVDTLAFQFLRQGLCAGDRVLLQLPNWPEFVVSYFALQKAGLVPVLLTVNHTARELSHLARLTEPRGWILPSGYRNTPDYEPLARQIQGECPTLEHTIFVGPERRGSGLWFGDLLRPTAPLAEVQETLERARPDPGDVCQLLPSGGTTGLPKCAPRTHNDYLVNIEYKSRAWNVNVTDTCLVTSTVGHNLALLVCVTAPVFHGAKIVLADSTYPEDLCRAIQEERVTCAGFVPTLISRLVSHEHLAEYDLSSLRRVYVGAANSPPDLVRSVEEKLGCRYVNAFGMVEGPCSQTRPEDPLEVRCQTIGRPVCPYDEFRTLDPAGHPTPPGVEGELAARGPGIFTGYFRNPQANQTAFTPDGYFRTGDLAVIEETGRIRITGRIKDIIIRGGENIAARDVEDLISSHPGVEYVAVTGMPDPDLGEQVCAYVTVAGGAVLTAAELIAHLQNLGTAKALLPARIEFVEKIPLTAAGKADKKQLRADIERKLVAEAGATQR
ncbi:MAG TPA: AMP-binding protein [Deferrisomatales bacterium]|nr:AMP-binding protein [Deferrisomatales bacterium]